VPHVSSFLFFGDVLLLALALVLGSPPVAFGAAAPAGVVAVVGCELLARRGRHGGVRAEPWRLDSWAVTVATLALLGLGASVGPDAVGAVWLLVALFAGLGFASLANLAPRRRP
jgi:hypothetical protein